MNDFIPFQHGDEGTHTICASRLRLTGVQQARCCSCEPHQPCDIRSASPKVRTASVPPGDAPLP